MQIIFNIKLWKFWFIVMVASIGSLGKDEKVQFVACKLSTF